MRTPRSPFLWLSLALAVGLGWALAAPDPVFPVYGVVDQPRSNSSTQPVDVMNWLIDENGNLRVSNQVRSTYVRVLDEYTPILSGEPWTSDPVNVSAFQTAFVIVGRLSSEAGVSCRLEFRWAPDLNWFLASAEPRAFDSRVLYDGAIPSKFPIEGAEARLYCYNSDGSETAAIRSAHLFLRAE